MAGRADPLAGTGFQVKLLLASGSTGDVYLAQQAGFGHRVVAKVLRPELTRVPTALGEAFAAIRTLNRLDRGDLVRTLDVRSSRSAGAVLVMERARGMPLSHVDPRSLDAVSATRLLIRLCHAVGAAHQLGLAHGDLRPSHVVVDGTGLRARPLVIDFVGSRLIAAARARGLRSRSPPTSTHYRAPEWSDGAPATIRADVFSLGMMGNALLLQRPENRAATSSGVVDVIMQALSADPAARPTSGRAMARSLAEALQSQARAAAHFVAGSLLEVTRRPRAALAQYEAAEQTGARNVVVQARSLALRAAFGDGFQANLARLAR